MPWMPDGSDVRRGFNKLIRINNRDPEQGLFLRDSSERFGYYMVDGVRRFPVSSKARQSSDIGRGRLLQLRRYLRLTPEQFQELCECRLTGPKYHQIIRDQLGL